MVSNRSSIDVNVTSALSIRLTVEAKCAFNFLRSNIRSCWLILSTPWITLHTSLNFIDDNAFTMKTLRALRIWDLGLFLTARNLSHQDCELSLCASFLNLFLLACRRRTSLFIPGAGEIRQRLSGVCSSKHFVNKEFKRSNCSSGSFVESIIEKRKSRKILFKTFFVKVLQVSNIFTPKLMSGHAYIHASVWSVMFAHNSTRNYTSMGNSRWFIWYYMVYWGLWWFRNPRWHRNHLVEAKDI